MDAKKLSLLHIVKINDTGLLFNRLIFTELLKIRLVTESTFWGTVVTVKATCPS